LRAHPEFDPFEKRQVNNQQATSDIFGDGDTFTMALLSHQKD
jgi:hypothetical protein